MEMKMACVDSLCNIAIEFQTENALDGDLDLTGLSPTHNAQLTWIAQAWWGSSSPLAVACAEPAPTQNPHECWFLLSLTPALQVTM